MANTLLLFCDEAFFAGDHAGKNTLKNLITEPTIRIESKFENSFEVDNYMRLIIAGNDDWIAPADYGERRFATFDVTYDFPDAVARKRYFDAIQEQLEKGGYEALMYHLEHEVDITAVNLQELPDTKALQEQKLHDLNGIEGFWYELLQRGSLRSDGQEAYWNAIPTERLQEMYYKDMKDTGSKERKARATQFGIKLNKLCPGVQKRKLQYGDTHDVLCYVFPPLAESREAFEAFLKTKFDWQVAGHSEGTLAVSDLSGSAIGALLAKMDTEQLADVLFQVHGNRIKDALAVLDTRSPF